MHSEAAAITEPAGRPAAADLRPLMAAYQAGELSAFDRLYGALAPALTRYLTALTREPARTQDLLQETFLRIHRARHTWDPERRVEPWAFAIARHVSLMERRVRSRRRRHEVDAPGDLHEVAVSAESEALGENELLWLAVGRLARERSEVVILHHVWGFDFREIAGILGISRGAARVRASRGMAELRRSLRSRLGPA